MILLGGIANIVSGLAFLIKPDIVKSLLKIDFDPFANPLIGRFAAGVIVAFGCGYVYTYFWSFHNLSLLALGTCVRYWMAILCVYYYAKKKLDPRLFCLVAGEAFFFAAAFSIYIWRAGG